MARSVSFPWSRARRGRADRRSHRAPGTRPDRRRVARTMVTGSYATPPNGSGRLTPPHFGSRFGISARPPVPCRCSAALVVQQGTTSSARCSKRRSACSIPTGSGRCLRNTAFRVRRLNGLMSPWCYKRWQNVSDRRGNFCVRFRLRFRRSSLSYARSGRTTFAENQGLGAPIRPQTRSCLLVIHPMARSCFAPMNGRVSDRVKSAYGAQDSAPEQACICASLTPSYGTARMRCRKAGRRRRDMSRAGQRPITERSRIISSQGSSHAIGVASTCSWW
jgi:hypothetical protein